MKKLSNLPLDPREKTKYKYFLTENGEYYYLETELENGKKYFLTNYESSNLNQSDFLSNNDNRTYSGYPEIIINGNNLTVTNHGIIDKDGVSDVGYLLGGKKDESNSSGIFNNLKNGLYTIKTSAQIIDGANGDSNYYLNPNIKNFKIFTCDVGTNNNSQIFISDVSYKISGNSIFFEFIKVKLNKNEQCNYFIDIGFSGASSSLGTGIGEEQIYNIGDVISLGNNKIVTIGVLDSDSNRYYCSFNL